MHAVVLWLIITCGIMACYHLWYYDLFLLLPPYGLITTINPGYMLWYYCLLSLVVYDLFSLLPPYGIIMTTHRGCMLWYYGLLSPVVLWLAVTCNDLFSLLPP